MFKYRYLNHYKRKTPSGLFPNEVTLTWNIFDSDITEKWATVIKRKLAQEYTDVRPYSIHMSFPTMQNKYELFERMCDNVLVARKLRPELEWEFDLRKLDQKILNYLHECFHETLEKLDLTKEEKELHKDSLGAFKKLNHDIHAMENIIDLGSRENANSLSYYVINFGLFDKELREPLTDDLRIKHFQNQELPIFKPMQLILGYATVGKNFKHCVQNDDPDVVRDNMIRPQLDIGGEAMAVYHSGEGLKNNFTNWQYTAKKWNRNANAFLDKHGLRDLVDFSDPKNYCAVQPTLGVISDEFDSWSLEDFYALFNEYMLVECDLEDYE